MLVLIVIVLIVLWAVAVLISVTLKGLIHLLLVVALVVLIMRFVRGQPAIPDQRDI